MKVEALVVLTLWMGRERCLGGAAGEKGLEGAAALP